MNNAEIAALMARLYFTVEAAHSVLLQAGFPLQAAPSFSAAEHFWPPVMQLIENGMGAEDTFEQLVTQTASRYKGNKDVQALFQQMTGAQVTTPAKPISAEGPCPTLTLIGADLPDQFLQVIREQLGSDAPDLLYVSKQQCAVSIPDPGGNAAQLQQQIQELIETYAPGVTLQVAYERYRFRPYLLSELTVFGPDTTPYLLQSVPSTSTPGDIAAAIVAETRAMNDGRGGLVSTVVDAETDDGSERLDPDKTLHENNVRDKGKLRVGTKAVAGNISPELRMEAQLRMRAQIRRYAFGHPDFEIVAYDNEDLPNRITFELEGPGLAPPENLAQFLAGKENLSLDDYRGLPWEQLNPPRIGFHRFTMHLAAMFPVVAPYVVWETPIFHPNIWRQPQPGVRPGMVCLGPLMDGYRPDLDFSYLCQLLVDIGTYRNYDVVDASTFPDPPAALWARTPNGQRTILEIGGPPMREATTPDAERRMPLPMWVSTVAAHERP